MDEQLRINKYLSSIGYCSRREADRLLEQGKIQVDGHTAFVGERITKEQYITVNGIPVGEKPREIVIAFNKPKGIVCTSSVKEKNNIVDYLHFPTRIYPVGRLDKDSEGLILLTNDGELGNEILRARNFHEKEYIVTVNRPVTDEFLRGMAGGVPILDTITRKCKVEKLDKRNFRKNILSMNILERLDEKDKINSKRGAYYFVFNKEKYEEMLRRGSSFSI